MDLGREELSLVFRWRPSIATQYFLDCLMDRMEKPSIRLIAEKTGLSKATVANALNGTPTVARSTAERVLEMARAIGYQRNPMVGALMSAVRRSDGTSLQGVLAAVEINEPDRPEHGPFHRLLLEGCEECAQELGFGLEFFRLQPNGVSPERLSRILRARGIHGLVILPAWKLPDFSRFDWNWLTGVYADYLAGAPSLNFVSCDHYRTVLEALSALHRMGYRKPAMIFEKGREERIQMRTSAALRVFNASFRGPDPIEPLFLEKIARDEVMCWLAKENPDVVLTHGHDVFDWMRESGMRIPEEIGYVSLNCAKTGERCAGLDLRPRDIGRCAVEMLVAQVQRAAWGRRWIPTSTSIVGSLVPGPTIRAGNEELAGGG